MSHEALTWAWRQQLKTGPKFILVAIADRANHEGVCWPSIFDLRARTEMSERQVIRHIQHLIDEGLLERIERRDRLTGRQTSPLYVCHLENGISAAAVGAQIYRRAVVTARLPRAPQPVDNSPKAVDNSVDNSGAAHQKAVDRVNEISATDVPDLVREFEDIPND